MESEKFSKELQKELVQLVFNLRLQNIFPGEWESIYKGRGIEVADIKPFEPGDDLHAIDSRTLGLQERMRIIQRIVEKQLRIYVWADFSTSMKRFKNEEMFFWTKPQIRDIAIGIIFYSAAKIYCPTGLYPFGLKEKQIFPAKTGESYCQEVLSWILSIAPKLISISSGVEDILHSLPQLAAPQNVVFFISDFKQRAFERDFIDLLRPIVNKFDFIPIVVIDPLETTIRIKRSIRISVRSGSGGQKAELYLTPKLLREMQEVSQKHMLHLGDNFKKIGVEHMILDSPSIEDCSKVFVNFFQNRRR